MAAARAAAMETARMALAPNFDLFGRAVGFDHAAVEGALVGGVHAGDGIGDCGVHVADGFQHAFAEIVGFVAVAQLDGFVFAGGSAGRDRGAAERSVLEADVRFDCGIAAGIENFPAVNGDDLRGHHSP